MSKSQPAGIGSLAEGLSLLQRESVAISENPWICGRKTSPTYHPKRLNRKTRKSFLKGRKKLRAKLRKRRKKSSKVRNPWSVYAQLALPKFAGVTKKRGPRYLSGGDKWAYLPQRKIKLISISFGTYLKTQSSSYFQLCAKKNEIYRPNKNQTPLKLWASVRRPARDQSHIKEEYSLPNASILRNDFSHLRRDVTGLEIRRYIFSMVKKERNEGGG